MNIDTSGIGRVQRIFQFLIAYRWASLLPALWLVVQPGDNRPILLVSFGLAGANTLLITIFHRQLNRWLSSMPYLIGLDLLFAAGLIAISEGTHSPYYLYTLSPLLAGAFFFQMRGAILISGLFLPLYLFALAAAQKISPYDVDPNQLFTQIAGIWLIPVLVAYPSSLLKQLVKTGNALEKTRDHLAQQNQELGKANQQLKILHELTVLLQAAPDIWTVQQQVMAVVTKELGFPRAIVGLVDQIEQEVGDWRSEPPGNRLPPSRKLPLNDSSGSLIHALLVQAPPWYASGAGLTADPDLSEWLGPERLVCIPLNLRNHPVGVLLVGTGASTELPEDRWQMLEAVSSQAAVALGTTMVCIDRTRRLVVEQERNRIARDIHDTIAQSLFGIVFSLDACVTMLPKQAERVRLELLDLREMAAGVRDEVRRSIYDLWPTELDLDRFKDDLTSYVSRSARPESFVIEFQTHGPFERLSPAIRRTLYRVAQEALSNVVHHAGVTCAQLHLNVDDGVVDLSIRDQGRGFDPKLILQMSQNRDRFGLYGIQERVQTLGGVVNFISEENHGTEIQVRIPVREEAGLG